MLVGEGKKIKKKQKKEGKRYISLNQIDGEGSPREQSERYS